MRKWARGLRMPPPHSGYWAACEECEIITLELEAEGLSRSDAQAVAEAEHRKVQRESGSPVLPAVVGGGS